MSQTVPKEAGKLKKGDYMMLKDKPCKILETSHCKTGKHGAGKNSFVCQDIFTGKKVTGSAPSSSNVETPVVTNKKYSITNINSDGSYDCLDDEDEEQPSFITPNDEKMKEKIQTWFDEDKEVILVVLHAMGKMRITDVKEGEPL